MIKELIYDKLVMLRNKKRHDVLRLQWQKAELEKLIADSQRKQKEERI